MSDNSSMMMMFVVLLVVACGSSFFLLAGGGTGLWLWLNKSKDEETDNTSPSPSPTLSTSLSPSPPPESFDGLYGAFEEGTTLPNRGDAECRLYAAEYNKTNPTTPYVGYGVRNSAHGTTGPYAGGTCIFYKASQLENTSKQDTSKNVLKVTTKCMDPKNYPNNFCLSTPPPEVAKDPYIGHYSAWDEGGAGFIGEAACRANITANNARTDIGDDDKYVGFGIRDDNHPASARQTCLFYKKKHLVNATRLDVSKTPLKVTSKCTNGKSPDNWCS